MLTHEQKLSAREKILLAWERDQLSLDEARHGLATLDDFRVASQANPELPDRILSFRERRSEAAFRLRPNR